MSRRGDFFNVSSEKNIIVCAHYQATEWVSCINVGRNVTLQRTYRCILCTHVHSHLHTGRQFKYRYNCTCMTLYTFHCIMMMPTANQTQAYRRASVKLQPQWDCNPQTTNKWNRPLHLLVSFVHVTKPHRGVTLMTQK